MRLQGPFRSLQLSKRCLLLEAFFCLALARLGILTVPFRWLLKGIGHTRHPIPPSPIPSSRLAEIHQVAQAIRAAKRRAPWQSNCLTQAVAGAMMLRWRNFPNTLYLGVMREAGTTLQAHAWLQCDNLVVTGGEELDRYKVIAQFSRVL